MSCQLMDTYTPLWDGNKSRGFLVIDVYYDAQKVGVLSSSSILIEASGCVYRFYLNFFFEYDKK